MNKRSKKWLMVLAAALLLSPVQTMTAKVQAFAAQDESAPAAIEDGTYVPAAFSFSGGTGKLQITCPEIIVSEGEVSAALHFSSSYITYVKVDGTQYLPVSQDDEAGTDFLIPAALDQAFTIIACTTAMSTPHEVEYTLYLSLSDTDAADNTTDTTAEEVSDETTDESEAADEEETYAAFDTAAEYTAPEIDGLTYVNQVSFDYASGVDIYNYEDGYRIISVHRDGYNYLLVPEGMGVPEGIDSAWIVLQQPLDHIYIAATASMALFAAADAMDSAAYSALTADNWYVSAAVEAMEAGTLVYAGKYSQPDYEMLLAGGCDLAVESTMILHSPAVKEKLESLGIPVFVDYASYEEHPLGRAEWVKVYAAMCDKDEEAESFFDSQKQVLEDLENVENTGKTVAFFSVNSGGTVVVRSTDDYIPKMLELAGGNYVPGDLGEDGEGKKSSVTITMEEFYSAASQADYLVYNATIEAPIASLEELYQKSELFKGFKAVQEGHVWCTDKYLYQATDIVGQLIRDFHYMLSGSDESEMTFLKKIE